MITPLTLMELLCQFKFKKLMKSFKGKNKENKGNHKRKIKIYKILMKL